MRRVSPWLLIATGLLAAFPAARAQSVTPPSVAGLAAWYDLDTVHRRSRDGDAVLRWEDASGNGHDLTGRSDSRQQPTFRTHVLDERPIVIVGRANGFDVADPFELADHTIFLVFASELTQRALLSSEQDPKLGIVLREDGRFHYLQNGKNGDFRYNRQTPGSTSFAIVVLARQAGTLHCFINGHDLSSGLEVATPLRVARLFQLEHTPYVNWDGEGLRIGEMIFYDRYLLPAEREGVTRYLSERFGIPVHFDPPKPAPEAKPAGGFTIDESAVQFRASTRSDVNLNDEFVYVPWNMPGRVDGPFRLDSDNEGTRLYCTRDGTRLRASVRLPLRSRVPDARVRLLFLINKKRYVEQQATSAPFAGQTEEKASTVELQAEMKLDDGDYVEVVATRDGAEGVVRMPPGEALFIVERIE